uniref:SRCR domain-containing protein n=1 Tax=Ornithorhynchus anatinus TaxID=9258 RepID=A0A6I8MZ91_ORNAN
MFPQNRRKCSAQDLPSALVCQPLPLPLHWPPGPSPFPVLPPALTYPSLQALMAGWAAADKLRLADGESPCDGRLELEHNGQWGTVCDDDLDMKDAAVVCRQLGCGTAVSTLDGVKYGPGSGRVWVYGLYCQGTESRWDSCSFHPQINFFYGC